LFGPFLSGLGGSRPFLIVASRCGCFNPVSATTVLASQSAIPVSGGGTTPGVVDAPGLRPVV
jgi:hypothetical protein